MRRFKLASLLAIGLVLLAVQIAFAHERRTVGKYQLVVGFLNEPSYTNYPNGIDLRVTNTETNKPVEGLEKTIQAQVLFGGKSMPITLVPRFGQPGAYAGYFAPTRAGSYIFQFTGDIEGTPLSETFESGPGRFNDPEETTALQFPDKVQSPLQTAQQLKAAQDAAANAQMLAYAGIGLGLLGIVVGALAWSRSRPQPHGEPDFPSKDQRGLTSAG